VKKSKFRSKNRALADKARALLKQEQPMTLRQLFYRLISASTLRNDANEYKGLGQVMTRLREDRGVQRTWLVDHVRLTLRPSSWTDLADFAGTLKLDTKRCHVVGDRRLIPVEYRAELEATLQHLGIIPHIGGSRW
jgi:hypothetical protein